MLDPVLAAVHIHPVRSLAACTVGEAAVEPWGLGGDRRRMLTDAGGTVITQRQQPRLALIHADPLPDGGINLSEPGSAELDVEVPEPQETAVAVHPFGPGRGGGGCAPGSTR
ncbi:MOSC domain-containing protein [Streptomyces sp. NBC_00876]|uniref:MOSC N-terminal beta barrel domain-containing protein n=1 Tax=Streptomyces sp. NBC_00876 TaxID=2975853 RepID=UPI003867C085|nr:MOSC domain-containing protein [Streptomyces sp. NBC_00876]